MNAFEMIAACAARQSNDKYMPTWKPETCACGGLKWPTYAICSLCSIRR